MTVNLVGSQLNKYQILSEIGRGGMGVVYQGYDPLLDRKVAIKVLAPHLVWEKGFVERFLREARAAARLKHPNIVTIYDVGQDGDWFFFVMEYLEGQTLSALLRERGPLSPQQMLLVLHPLGDALDYAHKQGLVHRDIKPGNVIIGPSGEVALTDFGIAKAAQETSLTVTGTIMGTPEYMSPEHAYGAEVDYRTDLYSLAILAYEMLCGKAPFGGTTPHAVVYKQIHEPPPPISQVCPELPVVVEEVLAKALAKEPDARYGTASEFLAALDRALAQRVTEAPTAMSTKQEPLVEPSPAAEAPTQISTGQEPVVAPVPAARPETPSPGPAIEAAAPAQAAPGLDEAPTQLSEEGKPRGVPVAPPAEPEAPAGERRKARRPERSTRRIPRVFWLLGGLALVLIVGGAIGLGLGGGEDATPTAVAEESQPAAATAAPTQAPRATSAPAPTVSQPTEPEPECRDPAGCILVGEGEPVRLAAMLALTGPEGSLGLSAAQGAEMAIGERRQILGHPIELMQTDSRCDADVAAEVAGELAGAPEILAVIGPTCSVAAGPAAVPLCEAIKALISPSSTAPELTAKDRPQELGCFLRTASPDLVPPRAVASFAISTGFERAAAIHDGSPYSEMAHEIFVRRFEEMGGAITMQEALVPGGPDPGQLLEAIAATEPQMLYYPLEMEAAAHVTHIAREIPGLRDTTLVGSHELFTPGFLGAGGEAGVGTLVATVDVSTGAPGLREFVLRFEELHGGPPESPFHIFAYDAANMILAAIEEVAVQDDAGRLSIGRAALLERLYATKEFPGLSGRLTCNRWGNCSNSGVAIYEVVSPDPDSWNPGAGPESNPRKIWP